MPIISFKLATIIQNGKDNLSAGVPLRPAERLELFAYIYRLEKFILDYGAFEEIHKPPVIVMLTSYAEDE